MNHTFFTNIKTRFGILLITPVVALSMTACVANMPAANQAASTTQQETSKSAETASITKLNINTATEAEMLTIPGVGENMVKEFMEYRPFTNVEHFRKEIGKYVDATQLAEYEKYIVIEAGADAAAAHPAAIAKININTASEEELLKVPGVGENMLKEFLEYRPFSNIEHFRKEMGKYVDAAQLAEYEEYLFVPVNINTASEAELLTIPGVGENMLKEFLEYRPFTNVEHFRKEMGKYVDAAQLTEYEKYIVIQ